MGATFAMSNSWEVTLGSKHGAGFIRNMPEVTLGGQAACRDLHSVTCPHNSPLLPFSQCAPATPMRSYISQMCHLKLVPWSEVASGDRLASEHILRPSRPVVRRAPVSVDSTSLLRNACPIASWNSRCSRPDSSADIRERLHAPRFGRLPITPRELAARGQSV